ncbi:protein FAR1-RELATED SEQUENCE 5-like [Papaver somniferum]|uniref:protein FAR1-RELATED SEQUENCE 5-like n=1 Tax=Papaver somniferum TaxID=3469 RepID=UPI000E6FAFB9|nr:protein FAR1-RELATED SEQUENCE 5-like [Papaver somniferum]
MISKDQAKKKKISKKQLLKITREIYVLEFLDVTHLRFGIILFDPAVYVMTAGISLVDPAINYLTAGISLVDPAVSIVPYIPVEDQEVFMEDQEVVIEDQNEVMQDQPQPVQVSEDTSAHYANNYEWKDKEDAKKWARSQGLKKMCIIVQNKQVTFNDFQMLCECSLKYESHWKKGSEYKPKTARKKGVYNTKKTGCPFKLKFKFNDDKKMWYMEKVISGYHNHPIPESLINHPYSARLNPLEKELVCVLSKRRTRPIDILSGVKVLNPQNSSSLSTIYNEREKFRKESWEERVLMQQLLFLFEEEKYSTAYERNEVNEVEYLFVANPECVQLARCFHQILFMDCTYKTNKYKMLILNFVGQTSTKSTFTVETKESYLWGLQKVKLLYQEGYTPQLLITDKEEEFMWAIPHVFPYARHHLCMFHLWNNVQTNCKRVIWLAKKTEMERIKNLPLEIQQEEK